MFTYPVSDGGGVRFTSSETYGLDGPGCRKPTEEKVGEGEETRLLLLLLLLLLLGTPVPTGLVGLKLALDGTAVAPAIPLFGGIRPCNCLGCIATVVPSWGRTLLQGMLGFSSSWPVPTTGFANFPGTTSKCPAGPPL